jgi:hypothetical protein
MKNREARLGSLNREDLRRVLILWAVWSAGILVLAAALERLPPEIPSRWHDSSTAPPLARWDSGWYRSIAVEGYLFDPSQKQNNIGFYPLYPLLLRWISSALGTPIFWTGIAISLFCLGGALVLVADLAAGWSGREIAVPACVTLLLFPTSFFFASVYTESLFLLVTAGAIWGAGRGRWLLAGCCGLAACLTRFNGFLILAPLAWYFWAARQTGVPWLRRAPALALPIVGASLFPIYLWARFGDPLLYVHSKAVGWAKQAAPFWISLSAGAEKLKLLTEPGSGARAYLMEVGSALLFLLLAVLLARRGRVAEGLYVGVSVALLVSAGNVDGMHRFVLPLFPGFVLLAQILFRHKVLALVYGLAGAALGGFWLYRFIHWRVVA